MTEIGKEALSTENDEETVLARLRTFVHNDYKLARLYLERLTAIRSALSASALFMQHQARAAAAAQFYGTDSAAFWRAIPLDLPRCSRS